MAYTWIKVYTEVLDDPKMGRMPDHLWRRTIELFLLAGRTGRNGELPTVAEMAWVLRTTEAELTADLQEIEAIGIILKTDETTTVTNFIKRQAAMSDKERQQKHRDGVTNVSQNRYEKSNEVVTEVEVEEEEEEEEEEELTTETENRAAAPISRPATAAAKSEYMTGIHLGKAQALLLNVAQLPAVPLDQYPRIDTVYSMIQQHGEDATIDALKKAREKWINTQSKSGKLYSPINFGWVDWAMGMLSGNGLGEKPTKPDPFAALYASINMRPTEIKETVFVPNPNPRNPLRKAGQNG